MLLLHCALTYRIAFNRRAAKTPLPVHTREDAASFMARNKAELQAVRARQRREPKVPLRSDEEIETERRERQAEHDARHWIPMEFGSIFRKSPPPKPRDTHKQSTLQECLSSARSAKAVRPHRL
jgi:hypothetical protein